MTPRLSALRSLHPAALAGLTTCALVVVLAGGYATARAVEGSPTAATTPVADGTSTGGPTGTTGTGTGGGTGGGTNAAVAAGTQDGRTVYAIRLKLVQTSADTVDATNAAVAVNSGCTGCSTVAIAFEGVLVTGSPSTFDPTNLALAANVDCSGCTAFADAYQRVVQSSTRVRITGQGRRSVAQVRHDLESLRHEDLTLDQLRARVAADEQAFAAVLSTQVVPVGHETAPASAGTDVSDTPADATPSPQASGSDAPTADPASPASGTAAGPATSTVPAGTGTADPATSAAPASSPAAATASPSPSPSTPAPSP